MDAGEATACTSRGGGASWAVVAHEFAHGFGSLADEYRRSDPHSGSEPGEVNVTGTNWRAAGSPGRVQPAGDLHVPFVAGLIPLLVAAPGPPR